eukprot:CAMPEP_0168581552 /NCGR_PEP_ID=MMETSP0420-20121227/1479_1 /TAXON_ID=498008 /ORGANISM="Pessonella sp." /LENGTH=168 /DNA_ID=CAMNT_0008615919 /DNA_START=319 /DNA_END=825 /DNA_ORIENTATION=-
MSAPTVADLLHIVSKPDAQRVFDRVRLPESNDEPLSAAAALVALTPTRYRLLLPKPLRTLHAQVAQNLDNSLSQTELVEKMKKLNENVEATCAAAIDTDDETHQELQRLKLLSKVDNVPSVFALRPLSEHTLPLRLPMVPIHNPFNPVKFSKKFSGVHRVQKLSMKDI